MAGEAPSISGLSWRNGCSAHRARPQTARCKGAARAAPVEARRFTGCRFLALAGLKGRPRGQRLTVGMQRRVEKRLNRRDLDNTPRIHHGDPVSHFGNHAHIMADQQHREPVGRAKRAQVEDLRLDRDIKRRGRLAAISSTGLAARAMAINALSHAARKRVRIAPQAPRGLPDADGGKKLGRLFGCVDTERWDLIASTNWRPTVCTGFNAGIAS